MDEQAVEIIFDNPADMLSDKFIKNVKWDFRHVKIVEIISHSIFGNSTVNQLSNLLKITADKFENWPEKVKVDKSAGRINFSRVCDNAIKICAMDPDARNITICDISDNLATWDEDRKVRAKQSQQ